jgi:hypothetical protein
VVAAEFEGIPGTVQPFIKCDAAHLPGHWELTPSIVKDIVLEHVADWIGSQHDSHIGQWVVTEDNRWICTDKEQGWKYFGKDSLSTSYHPNAVYGERPPLYNDFWKSWARGEIVMDFGDLLPQAFENPPQEQGRLRGPRGRLREVLPGAVRPRREVDQVGRRPPHHRSRRFLEVLQGLEAMTGLRWYEKIWIVPLSVAVGLYALYANWRDLRTLKKAVRNGTFGRGGK